MHNFHNMPFLPQIPLLLAINAEGFFHRCCFLGSLLLLLSSVLLSKEVFLGAGTDCEPLEEIGLQMVVQSKVERTFLSWKLDLEAIQGASVH